jgi:hypothetical protein
MRWSGMRLPSAMLTIGLQRLRARRPSRSRESRRYDQPRAGLDRCHSRPGGRDELPFYAVDSSCPASSGTSVPAATAEPTRPAATLRDKRARPVDESHTCFHGAPATSLTPQPAGQASPSGSAAVEAAPVLRWLPGRQSGSGRNRPRPASSARVHAKEVTHRIYGEQLLCIMGTGGFHRLFACGRAA